MTGSYEARGVSGAGIIANPDQCRGLVRRRWTAVLSELLLCTLVLLSTATRQPARTHQQKWHTCKASKMLESSGKLAREEVREQSGTKYSAPDEIKPPSIIPRLTSYQFIGLPAFEVFRSPPQA